MGFWQGGFVIDLLIVIALVALASTLRRSIPALRRFGVPDALVAGFVGLLVGPSGLGWLDFDSENLKTVVYHGLALIFITVSLQSPAKGPKSGAARSIAFTIPVMISFQAILGLGLVLLWNLASGDPSAIHPGMGLLLPLGFSQGPGASMTLGSGWEAHGFVEGGQLGLIFSTVGFAWCCIMGVGLVSFARARGWVNFAEADKEISASEEAEVASSTRLEPGSLEPLMSQVVATALVYLAVYALLSAITPVVPTKHVNTLWAFHFIFGTALAMVARLAAARFFSETENPLEDVLLARMSSVIVDLTTACALAAVSLAVVAQWLAPIIVFTSVCGVMTLVLVLWISKRAFSQLSFHHAIITFGAMTGTATTGMALLRMLDPELRTQAARNFVMGSAGASLLALPMLALIPFAVVGWPETYPTRVFILMGILLAYGSLLVVVWRKTTDFRFTRPLHRLWPDDA
jgi:ESS family glutamate:Na+ symporter